MNWIERYVNAVKNDLPRKDREDVAEELTSLLEEELEMKEESLGRKLESAEIKSWLAGKDHPSIAAAGYRERRVLIGETIYPYYKQTLKVFLLVLAVFYTCLAGVRVLSTGDFMLVRSFMPFISSYLETGLIGAAVITVIFHFSQNVSLSERCFPKWNPDHLPTIERKWQNVSYMESITEFIMTLALVAWLNGFLPLDTWGFTVGDVNANSISFSWTDGLLPYLFPINLILFLYMGIYLSQFFRPYWNVWTLSFNALLGLAITVILILLVRQLPLVEITTTHEAIVDKIANFENIVNQTLKWVFSLGAVFNFWETLRDVYRTLQLARK